MNEALSPHQGEGFVGGIHHAEQQRLREVQRHDGADAGRLGVGRSAHVDVVGVADQRAGSIAEILAIGRG